MALSLVNPGVRLQEVEVTAPDGAGNFGVTIRYSMRDGYFTRSGFVSGTTTAPASEAFYNDAIAEINDAYDTYTT
jgi:hypothetical protein